MKFERIPIIDYAPFDYADRFFLLSVPWLWADLIPQHPTTVYGENDNYEAPPEVMVYDNYIRSAILKGDLKCDEYIKYLKLGDAIWESSEPGFFEITILREDLKNFALAQGKKPPFLFPEEREKKSRKEPNPPSQTIEPPKSGVTHSDDFRSMDLKGVKYSFTTQQARVVKFLFEQPTHEASDAAITENCEVGKRIRDTFRNNPAKKITKGKKTVKKNPAKIHPAWGKLIIQGGTKGTRRLDLDPK